jgi:hypothetical protein
LLSANRPVLAHADNGFAIAFLGRQRTTESQIERKCRLPRRSNQQGASIKNHRRGKLRLLPPSEPVIEKLENLNAVVVILTQGDEVATGRIEEEFREGTLSPYFAPRFARPPTARPRRWAEAKHASCEWARRPDRCDQTTAPSTTERRRYPNSGAWEQPYRYSATGDDILQKINIAPKSTLPASTQPKDQAAQAGQLQKILDFVSGLIDPSGKSQPLGQVNGALGETSVSAVGHSAGLCKLGSLSLMATAAFP